MEMRYYLATFLTAFVLSSTEASKGAGKVKIKSRSPVYFPVIPIGSFDDDFGSRVAESISHSRRVSPNKVDNSPLVLVHKITTTTEKLPLAQESHVASNSITEAPGPAYLTDSLYYLGDPTPDPLEGEDYDRGYINIQDLQDSSEGGEREREVLGVYLQSILSSYEPPVFSKSRNSFDHLVNPAKMHFIPPNLGESDEGDNRSKLEDPPSTYIASAKTVTSESAEDNPPLHQAISSYEAPKYITSPVVDPQPPVVSSILAAEKLPENYKPPIITTKAPVVRYEAPAPTRAARVLRIKPATTKRVQIPHTTVLSNAPASSSSAQSLFVKSSELFATKPAASIQTSSGVSSRPPSSRYLPKPAPNPFAAKISQPVVKPVYGSESKVEISNFPASLKQSSLANFSPITVETGRRSQLTDAPQRNFQSNTNGSNRKQNFGERKTNIGKTVEIYVPPSSLEDQNILFESRKRDYGFDFNSASASAPRRHYKPPSATLTPILEAPVYRTSTKSYRAPSSLFQAKETAGKPVTAPSQPEFIQTDANIYVPQEYDENAIPGIGGVDYPNFHSIPNTEFKCSSQEHPGLYADQETKCQVFHICQEGGREDSFLCPNGTVFNQQYFVCDWWYNFSCESAERFYSLNALIYELPDSLKYYS